MSTISKLQVSVSKTMLMYSIAVHSGISHTDNEKVETFKTNYQEQKDKTQDHMLLWAQSSIKKHRDCLNMGLYIFFYKY